MPVKLTSLLTKVVDSFMGDSCRMTWLPYQQKKTGPTVLSDVVSLAENIEVVEAADVDEAIIKLGGSG